jgi:undecaprenyl phosphate-alpha-L-ara4FN deformylase
VVSTYGIRTLLNGVLLPGPHVGRRNEGVMRMTRDKGYEAGVHCYDHIRWQDGLAQMTRDEVFIEFGKAQKEFERIFRAPAKTAGAAGWQANGFSLAAYDEADLLYGSDCRGTHPFYPRVEGVVYKTLQIPTTLPTLDELLGRPEYPLSHIAGHYLSLVLPGKLNVLTIHAEIEGMRQLSYFKSFLKQIKTQSVQVVKLGDMARDLLKNPKTIPVCDLISGTVDGRSGTLAVQSCKGN